MTLALLILQPTLVASFCLFDDTTIPEIFKMKLQNSTFVHKAERRDDFSNTVFQKFDKRNKKPFGERIIRLNV